jgi:hypothetical protein
MWVGMGISVQLFAAYHTTLSLQPSAESSVVIDASASVVQYSYSSEQ